MPYKDPEKKREQMKAWRKHSIEAGYGKWLYARRKLRFDDAERFRKAIDDALAALWNEPLTDEATPASTAIAILTRALHESQEAEEALGRWKGEDDGQEGS